MMLFHEILCRGNTTELCMQVQIGFSIVSAGQLDGVLRTAVCRSPKLAGVQSQQQARRGKAFQNRRAALQEDVKQIAESKERERKE